MSDLKISVIGAGSYVFGPSILNQCISENRFDCIEISLHDLDHEAVELMARIGQRMVREQGLKTRVTFTTDRRASLDGAAFIVYCAAPQIFKRFEMDADIIKQYAPGEFLGEFGGIAGISYSLRQIALMEQVAADIVHICPEAWLLCTANPLPRVIQAAHQLGIKSVAGFCSVSSEVYGGLLKFFDGQAEPYPWTKARARWEIKMGGLNHFSWLLSLRENTTGRDIYPELRERIRAGESTGNPRSEAFVRETGWMLLPNDHHTDDFLPPGKPSSDRKETAHGTAPERKERLKKMRDIADGRSPWNELVHPPSWERPADLIGALALKKPASFNSLNLLNAGQIPQLPRTVFVETPASADENGIRPETVELPPAVAVTTQHTALVTDTIVRGALARDRRLLREAVELDPSIVNKTGAHRALEACIEAHFDKDFKLLAL